MAYTVEEIDSGCCGMAGSFGYEKEHYEISIAIGRRRLFPAVENNPSATVVAPGISCRQQVEHATGRRALHPAEALAKAL
jgi:Fe-S oxidoreductase